MKTDEHFNSKPMSTYSTHSKTVGLETKPMWICLQNYMTLGKCPLNL